MTDTATGFREAVARRFGFLERRGFRPTAVDGGDSPVGNAVAYLGSHVGFVITWDARDQVVDMRVVRVRDGRMPAPGGGGYTRDLFVHLVEHAGYRGSPSGTHATGRDGAEPGRLERAVAAWASLLETAGGTLLDDTPDALPTDVA